MKKFASFLLILSLLLALAIPGFAFSAALSDQLLSVDGLTVNCEKYNVDGFNYFKLRDLAMALSGTESQFSVGYDEATDTVSIHSGAAYTAIGGELEIGDDKSVSACQSSQIITVNGSVVEGLSVYNIGGNNYFKLRDLADYIGFKVGYNESTRTALVTSARTHRVLSTEELYELCTPAVFKVETYDGLGNVLAWGSGFFLTESGLAVTNFHVISGASSAKVTLSATGDFDDAAAVRSVLGVYDYSEAEDWAPVTRLLILLKRKAPSVVRRSMPSAILWLCKRRFPPALFPIQTTSTGICVISKLRQPFLQAAAAAHS